MKITGIICEYNPFHSGHLYHLSQVKKEGGTVMCIMSGNFTQRGEPSCLDKYVRAKHAVLSGADIVLELPVVYAAASAENFAFGAVRILEAAGCNELSFGSECGDLSKLTQCAEQLLNPSPEMKGFIRKWLDKGFAYPAALAHAFFEQDEEVSAILSKPNNVLGIEYVKQLILNKSLITPQTVTREDNYNSTQSAGNYLSATAIRAVLEKGEKETIKLFVPPYVFCDLQKPLTERYKKFLYTFLGTLTKEYLSTVEGVTEGLHSRIAFCSHAGNYALMMEKLKTRRYTLAKLQRILLNATLGITQEIVKRAKEIKPYTRVLAISKTRLDLLTHLSQCKINLAPNVLKQQEVLRELDLKASNLYYSLSGASGNKDLTQALQKI